MIRFASPGPIGIDINPRSIAAVQLDSAGRISAATLVARRPSAPGAPFSADEARALDQILYRQGFTGRRVAIAVPDDKLLTESLDLPPKSSGAPLDQLARMEICRAHKRDPDSFELAVWDVPSPSRAAEASYVMCAACQHQDAEALLDAFESAGFSVATLNTRAWALASACRPLLDPASLSAILDVGEHAALLSVVHSGTLVYQRVMRDAGLGVLRSRIRDALSITPEVADYLLDSLGQVENGDQRRVEDAPHKEATAILDEHTTALAAELRTAIDYTGHRYPATIDRLAVSGAGAVIPSVIDRLSTNLKMTARAAAPAELAACQPSVAAASQNPALTVALGLSQWGRRAA